MKKQNKQGKTLVSMVRKLKKQYTRSRCKARIKLVVLLSIGLMVAIFSYPLTSLAIASGIASMTSSETNSNVVLFVVDDMRQDDLKHMPETNRLLVDKGTSFTNNYSPQPQCCPARSSILTGQYPHNHNVLDNYAPLGGVKAFNDTNTIATYLTPTYRTSLIGKYLNGYGSDLSIPPGWDDWRVPREGELGNYLKQTINVNGRAKTYEGYMTNVYGQLIRDSIKQTPVGQPYFNYAAWFAPHTGKPFVDGLEGAPYVPSNLRGAYTGPKISDSPAYNEASVTDKRSYIANLPKLTEKDIATSKKRMQARRDSLVAVDQQISKTIDLVKERGELEKTYFIFVSDNGFLLGEHRLDYGKMQLYEEAAHVPMVIRGPGFPAGYKYKNVTGLQDLTPTILDLTGTILPEGAPAPDGVSVRKLINGTLRTTRPQVLEIANNSRVEDNTYERSDAPSQKWYARGIVTNDGWKYVEYPITNEYELYNLTNDKYEQQNVYDASTTNSALQSVQTRMKNLLERYKDCSGDACSVSE